MAVGRGGHWDVRTAGQQRHVAAVVAADVGRELWQRDERKQRVPVKGALLSFADSGGYVPVRCVVL